jgi:hypothetical protein
VRETELALIVDQTATDVLRVSQFGGSVGVAPVTVGVMRVRTITAKMGATVVAEVKMIAAKILVATET